VTMTVPAAIGNHFLRIVLMGAPYADYETGRDGGFVPARERVAPAASPVWS
jgi:hypothetical protein